MSVNKINAKARNAAICNLSYYREMMDMPEQKSKANDKQIAGDHYKTPVEPWDAIIAWELGYLDGNVVKYMARWRKKGGLDDLKKAQHYLEKLIEQYSNRAEEVTEQYDYSNEKTPQPHPSDQWYIGTDGDLIWTAGNK